MKKLNFEKTLASTENQEWRKWTKSHNDSTVHLTDVLLSPPLPPQGLDLSRALEVVT